MRDPVPQENSSQTHNCLNQLTASEQAHESLVLNQTLLRASQCQPGQGLRLSIARCRGHRGSQERNTGTVDSRAPPTPSVRPQCLLRTLQVSQLTARPRLQMMLRDFAVRKQLALLGTVVKVLGVKAHTQVKQNELPKSAGSLEPGSGKLCCARNLL